jgi:hypothetical protein
MMPLTTPTKVYQDDFSPAKGNALQAAVASMFGLQLHDVPNFIESPIGYESAITQFHKQLGGKQCSKIMKLDHEIPEKYDNTLCLLRGKSPRGNFGHVVVARHISKGNFEMIHDPHPDATFLDKAELFGWCLFFE